MEQLRMLLIDGNHIPVNAPDGWYILSHADMMRRYAEANPKASEEELKEYDGKLADGWLLACESLNGSIKPRETFYKDMIGDPDCGAERIFYIVRRSDDFIGGTATAKINPETPSLHMVGAANCCKGQGLSLSVCAAATNAMIDAGIRSIRLLTNDFRIPALKTYLKLGYMPWYYLEDMRDRWNVVFDELGEKYDRKKFFAYEEDGVTKRTIE